ncbi:MAG: ADP-glyceromanno-heptose 6-epimerase [Bacteriovoracaceae bacterium]
MILVTGGAGFIGSVLVSELNRMGEKEIIIVDRLGEDSKWLNLRGKKFEEYIHADEFFMPENEHLIEEIKMIYHLGACSSTTERDVDYLMKNNFNYSRALYQLAVDLNIPFIYASSAAVYGDGELGYDDEHGLTHDLQPLNPYGYSKLLFDQWILEQEVSPEYWIGLRFFNVFGPNETHKDDMRSLVEKGFEQIQENSKVKLFKSHREGYGDGEQKRDFIYVKDVVRAILQFQKEGSASLSGIYNLGTGKAHSFKELIQATFKAMDKEENIEYFDMPERFRDQYQYFTEANMNRFFEALKGFEFTSLEDSVKDYVTEYLAKGKTH